MTYTATVRVQGIYSDDNSPAIITDLEDRTVTCDELGNLIWIGDNFVIAQSSFVSVTFTENDATSGNLIGFVGSSHTNGHSSTCRCGIH